jgi:hypothetical protein
MVVACIALLVAMSGTGIAAVAALPNNSVGPAQLKANAVTNPKIAASAVTNAKLAPDAVTSAKVRNGSLQRGDFAAGQLPSGPIGPKGDKGDKGDKGETGPQGVIGAITVRSSTVLVDGGAAENGSYATRPVTRNCDSDEKAISAGTGWSDDVNDLELVTSSIKPILNAQNQVIGFAARGGNDSGNDSTFTLYVLCYKG